MPVRLEVYKEGKEKPTSKTVFGTGDLYHLKSVDWQGVAINTFVLCQEDTDKGAKVQYKHGTHPVNPVKTLEISRGDAAQSSIHNGLVQLVFYHLTEIPT